MLEKELIERGMKYFRSNLVTTNGTLELPDWPDVNFSISQWTARRRCMMPFVERAVMKG